MTAKSSLKASWNYANAFITESTTTKKNPDLINF